LNLPLCAVQWRAVRGFARPTGTESVVSPLPADIVRFRTPLAKPNCSDWSRVGRAFGRLSGIKEWLNKL